MKKKRKNNRANLNLFSRRSKRSNMTDDHTDDHKVELVDLKKINKKFNEFIDDTSSDPQIGAQELGILGQNFGITGVLLKDLNDANLGPNLGRGIDLNTA